MPFAVFLFVVVVAVPSPLAGEENLQSIFGEGSPFLINVVVVFLFVVAVAVPSPLAGEDGLQSKHGEGSPFLVNAVFLFAVIPFLRLGRSPTGCPKGGVFKCRCRFPICRGRCRSLAPCGRGKFAKQIR
jgi:hypothetical protein